MVLVGEGEAPVCALLALDLQADGEQTEKARQQADKRVRFIKIRPPKQDRVCRRKETKQPWADEIQRPLTNA
ncbi:MAG: hypothetical protein ACLT0Y_00210 [Christensenellales bacterium]